MTINRNKKTPFTGRKNAAKKVYKLGDGLTLIEKGTDPQCDFVAFEDIKPSSVLSRISDIDTEKSVEAAVKFGKGAGVVIVKSLEILGFVAWRVVLITAAIVATLASALSLPKIPKRDKAASSGSSHQGQTNVFSNSGSITINNIFNNK
jgi:hypothetical protein